MVAGTHTNFAQAGVGVAVKAGAPKPDISTVAAFKAAMLNAKSIGYSARRQRHHRRAGDGEARHRRCVEGADPVHRRPPGRRGRRQGPDVEIGLQQINVIIPVEGADYVGPLPKELQDTVKFAGGVLTVAKEPEVAKAFLKFIASPEAAPLIRKSAMEPWS